MNSKNNPIFNIRKMIIEGNIENAIYQSFDNVYPIQILCIEIYKEEKYALTKFINLLTKTMDQGYFKTSLFKKNHSLILIYFYEQHIASIINNN